ncbi:YjdF family protein [Actinocrispum sp. NPDC049592]|uniref:YjdF family protein n=1 Tax=Actinocrispum sp. NPDC049592 TaxID=3154835 RepID=UPI003429C945
MREVFTVYFDGQFWVGVLELYSAEGVRAARHIFGAEPTNPELLEFASKGEFLRLSRLAAQSPPVPVEQRALSWKRELKNLHEPVGTAAQRALKAATAARAVQGKATRKERAEADRDRRRELARAKAKARHRGR